MRGNAGLDDHAIINASTWRWAGSAFVFALALCMVLMCFGLVAQVASAHEFCENEGRRIEQGSAMLPNCRAYELVTPPGKESDEPKAVVVGLSEPSLKSQEGMHALITGNRMAWTSEYVLPGSAAPGLDYLSTRGVTGWSSENVIPQQSVQNGTNCPGLVAMAAYSSNLSTGVLADGFGQPRSFKGESLDCGHDEPILVSGEPQGFQNLFLRNNETSSYQLVNVTPTNAPAPQPALENDGQYFPASFLAGSNDLSHVVFEEELPLTVEAGDGDELYAFSSDTVHLVTILPGGTPTHGTLAGATRNTGLEESTQEFVPYNIASFRHAVSGNGLRIFFEAGGNLYVRINPEQPHEDECADPSKTCTVQVDGVEGGSGSSGAGKFMVASEDGSKVFFTDENRLTSNSGAEAGKPDLYEYDLEKPAGERLSDLTASSSEPADVLGVNGASEDGSHVYFVAEGVLTGKQRNSQGAQAHSGQPNLYVFDSGATTFVATLDATNDSCDWMSQTCLNSPLFGGLTARVSANGAFIAFDSDESLTGYHNIGSTCVPDLTGGSGVEGFAPGACEEIYLYDAAANSLSCASCDPSGAAPAGPAVIRSPGDASQDNEMRNAYPQRNVSDFGEVFFETADALVPSATNGELNVYAYENAQPYLISNGTSEANAYFLDASVDGSNIFFATAQRLLTSDNDTAYDIYDARVDGGFPEPPGATTPCQSEGCRAPATVAPVFTTPSTVSFNEPASGLASSAPKVQTTANATKGHKKKKKKKVRKKPSSASKRDKGHKSHDVKRATASHRRGAK